MNVENLPLKIVVSGVSRTNEIRINGSLLFPNESFKYRNHSPDGFNWGYSGSGPAQLALAMLLKFLPVDVALSHYQTFKAEVVAGFPMKDFEVEVEFRKIMLKILNP